MKEVKKYFWYKKSWENNMPTVEEYQKIEKYKSDKIARKVLNELKYSKKSVHLWGQFSKELCDREVTDNNILDILSNMIIELINDLENSSLEANFEEISAKKLLKKIRVSSEEKFIDDNSAVDKNKLKIISFAVTEEMSKHTFEYNYHLSCSLEVYLLGAIWVERIGKELNDDMHKYIYANRVSDKSNSFFIPYFKSYNDYRNDAFGRMEEVVDKKETAIVVQSDIRKFYNNINIWRLENKVEKKMEKDFSLDVLGVNNLNKLIFKIIDKYNEKLIENEGKKIKKYLPIGFLPSSISSNFYLEDFDEEVINNLNPIFYGRYVDDITIIVSNHSKIPVKNKCNEIEEILKESLMEITNDQSHLNGKKTLFFEVHEQTDENYIEKFKKLTERLSSDFYKLTDIYDIDSEFEKAYILESPTKMSEFFEIVKDKKVIGKIISATFNTVFSSLNIHLKRNIMLIDTLIEKLKNSLSDTYFLEVYDYWLSLFLLEKISKEFNETLGKKESKDSYKDFFVVKRINDIKDQYNNSEEDGGLTRFFEIYLNTFQKICTDQGVKILAENFTKPKYSSEIYKNYKEEIFLEYEKQLNTLYSFLGKSLNKSENFTEKIREVNGIFDNIVEPAEEIEEIESILLSQASIYSPVGRNQEFIDFNANIDTLSEIRSIINKTNNKKSNLLVFPEHAVNIHDIPLLFTFARKHQIVIIGGLDYIYNEEKVYNLSFVIKPYKNIVEKSGIYDDAVIKFSHKAYPAPKEYEEFHQSSSKEQIERAIYIPTICEADYPFIFSYNNINHAIFNCYEATDLKMRASLVGKNIDFVHIIANNMDVKYYDNIMQTISRDLMCITTITNYSIYGGIQVYIPFREHYRRLQSSHKGSEKIHVFESNIDIQKIKKKRNNNSNGDFMQNPPNVYYKNVGGRK